MKLHTQSQEVKTRPARAKSECPSKRGKRKSRGNGNSMITCRVSMSISVQPENGLATVLISIVQAKVTLFVPTDLNDVYNWALFLTVKGCVVRDSTDSSPLSKFEPLPALTINTNPKSSDWIIQISQ
jgi:hypothetical protein